MRSFKLFLLFFTVLGAGCGRAVINFDSDALRSAPLVPHFMFSLSFEPRVFFRSDTNTVLIINRVDLSKKQLHPFDMETARTGVYTALRYAGDQLAQVRHVRVINLADSLNLQLNTDSIASLAARYHADYTLALEKYNDTVVFSSAYLHREYYDNEVDLKFTMYLGKGNLYKELRGSDTLRSMRCERDSVATALNHASGDANLDFIVSATQNAVFAALAEYLPYTETESRPLYGNPKLGPLADAIMAGQYENASRLSQPFLSGRDTVMACRAAYNMAVVYESQGDLGKAMNMAQLSFAKCRNSYARSLITYLKSK